MSSRKPTVKDMTQLAALLLREGYHREPKPQLTWDTDGLALPLLDTFPMPCQVKPYRMFIYQGAINILHSCLNGYDIYPERLHERVFLEEMIPVIGKYDALAQYDPGNIHTASPHLVIYM